MTLCLLIARFGPAAEPRRAEKSVPVGWTIALVALVVVTAIVLVVTRTGISNDARLQNQTPGPAAEDPLFGIENWPLIFSLIFVVVAVLFLIVFWLERLAVDEEEERRRAARGEEDVGARVIPRGLQNEHFCTAASQTFGYDTTGAAAAITT